ncbi:hypothetical protein [Scytonema sp. PRP1]|uniref:hypothetical protein n=1 Tax=Scytonema sp. PRP1 TaxID=3120513 RepID=UPI002FD56D13
MHITIAEKQDPRLLKEVGDLCLSATSQRDRLRRGAAHRLVKLQRSPAWSVTINAIASLSCEDC